ncbi:MAG: hypothetical protein AAB343_02875 [Patescibacteria group bacterium]
MNATHNINRKAPSSYDSGAWCSTLGECHGGIEHTISTLAQSDLSNHARDYGLTTRHHYYCGRAHADAFIAHRHVDQMGTIRIYALLHV